MKTTIILVISLTLYISVSCKKERKLPITEVLIEKKDTCFCAPKPSPLFVVEGINVVYGQTYSQHLEMNPKNSNEIIYLKKFPDKLVYFNRETLEKRILFDGSVIGELSWSIKDWILFQKSSDFSLYKIKSNGDSLTKLTTGNAYHHGVWNNSGDKIVAYHRYKQNYSTRILDQNGLEIDSTNIWKHSGGGDWSHPLYYLSATSNEIVLLDKELKTIVQKFKILKHPSADISILSWVSPNEFWYKTQNRLYLFNIESNESLLLKCVCKEAIVRSASNQSYSSIIALQHKYDSISEFVDIIESSILVMEKDSKVLQQYIP